MPRRLSDGLLLLSLAVAAQDQAGSAQAPTSHLCGQLKEGHVRTLLRGVRYRLACQFFVRPGALLVVEPGVTVEAIPPDASFESLPAIVVQQTGRIVANGTAELPITFTAEQPFAFVQQNVSTDTTAAGSTELGWRGKWGGIVILGRAPIAQGHPTYVEGLEGMQYGGTVPDDDSGVLRYVRIWHSGALVSADNELNGLTLAGVGRGTRISHVEVAFCLDDGFEFFGGTVNVDHLSSLFIGDDAFDADAGYQGHGQFLFSMLGAHGDHGFEVDSFNGSRPRTHPAFYSLTVIGAPQSAGSAGRRGPMIHTRHGAAGQFGNAILAYGGGLGAQLESCSLAAIEHAVPRASAGGGSLDVLYFSSANLLTPCGLSARTCEIVVNHACDADEGVTAVPEAAYPDHLNATVAPAALGFCASCDGAGDADAQELDCLLEGVGCGYFDPTPREGGPACTGAVDEPPAASFEPVACKGAFAAPGANWLAGWSVLYEPAYQFAMVPPAPPVALPPIARPALPPPEEASSLGPIWVWPTLALSLIALALTTALYRMARRMDRMKDTIELAGVKAAVSASVPAPGRTTELSTTPSDSFLQRAPLAAPTAAPTAALTLAPSTAPTAAAPDAPPAAGGNWPPDDSPASSLDLLTAATVSVSSSPSIFQAVVAWNKYRRFAPLCVLGRGSSGVAVLMHDGQQQRVVSKRIVIQDLGPGDIAKVENEVLILKQLHSKHIVRYLDSFHELGVLCLIMEYAEGGNLQKVLRGHAARGEVFTSAVTHVWMHQLVSALALLHESSILHRDIKTSNIFLSAAGDVKLGDFGLARILEAEERMAETACGTPYYLSPEKPYSQPSDLWALGVVLYELLTFVRPFRGENVAELVRAIQVGTFDEALPAQSGHAAPLAALCTSAHLLHADPQRRITLPALKQYLLEHAAASGVCAAQLAEGHEDCRAAVRVSVQTQKAFVDEAVRQQAQQVAHQQAAQLAAQQASAQQVQLMHMHAQQPPGPMPGPMPPDAGPPPGGLPPNDDEALSSGSGSTLGSTPSLQPGGSQHTSAGSEPRAL